MRLINGDCLVELKKLEDNSVDSLITDPPAGISFMGKDWDHHKGGRDEWIAWMSEVMRECNRVLKPGAHALVWAIPRTSHWTTTAIENAGFEIRDVVTHLFGSGFPKSLDISKAIDKEAGAKREIIGPKISPDGIDYSKRRPSQNEKQWNDYSVTKYDNNITAPATDDAKKWQGWGTALKPAAEFWVLARKPLSEKTVAKNVLKHGTGGLNIDGSRIATQDVLSIGAGKSNTYGQASSGSNPGQQHAQGRFPANLVLSGDAPELLDEQSGQLSKQGSPKTKDSPGKMYGGGTKNTSFFGDSGGASRFFYCAKVSPSERGEGNTHPTVKPQKLMQYLIKLITPPGGTVLDPFMGSGSTGIAAKSLGFAFIGIEQEKEYIDIATARIAAANEA